MTHNVHEINTLTSMRWHFRGVQEGNHLTSERVSLFVNLQSIPEKKNGKKLFCVNCLVVKDLFCRFLFKDSSLNGHYFVFRRTPFCFFLKHTPTQKISGPYKAQGTTFKFLFEREAASYVTKSSYILGQPTRRVFYDFYDLQL